MKRTVQAVPFMHGNGCCSAAKLPAKKAVFRESLLFNVLQCYLLLVEL